jgi:hypothetical protein
MESTLFIIFFFAIIVQCCHSAGTTKSNSNPSPKSLKDIINEQKAKSDVEKLEQEQRGPASYLDKVKTSTSKGTESEVTKTKVAKEVAKLKINEATTAADEVS